VSERPYADPYVAGIGLGLVLLAAFVLADRGLGVSGAFGSAAATTVAAVAPARAEASPVFARYLVPGAGYQVLAGSRGTASTRQPAPGTRVALRDAWPLFEIAGVIVGGFLSALLAGRLRRAVERGPRISRGARLGLAFAGGGIMGVGAMLARGCTSGLALTGGALLSVGSWIFVASAFAAAYLVAPLVRRAWR